jgi:hypothetical protein
MRRLLVLMLPLSLAAPALQAQAADGLEVGARVRVTIADADGGRPARLVGTVAERRADALLLGPEGEAAPREVPWARVGLVEVSRGQGSRAGAGARGGALVGALVLGTAVYLGERSSETCTSECDYRNPSVVPMTALGVAAGALGGAYVGRRLGALMPAERWEAVPARTARARGSARELALRLRF